MSLPNKHFGAARIEALLRNCKRLLFIGVGGVSMCSLAELALLDGLSVIGSDRCESPRLDRLRAKGAEICVGHDAAHAESADVAIYTVAIGEDNVEYQAMKQPLLKQSFVFQMGF